jgi:hypothetical protein
VGLADNGSRDVVTISGVLTKVRDIMQSAVKSTNSQDGYFKPVKNLINSQQNAIKKEIASNVADLNALNELLAGEGSNSDFSAYLSELEKQYQYINDAIAKLNSQYSVSMTRLILNQNNASFNPVVK